MNSTTSAIPTRHDRRAGRAATILLALMFAALGVPVYLLGAKAPPPGRGTTSAIVRLPADTMSRQQARAEILAQPNVRRAVDACRTEDDVGPCSPATLQSVRDRLRVRLSTDKIPGASPSDVQIECTYDTDPAAAVALANRLAEQFAESVRLRQKAEAGKAHREAQQAVVKARKKLTEVQGRLEKFLQQCFQPVKKPAAAGDSDRSAAVGKPAASKANPDWLAVRRQLDHARQYRAQLLIDRTPLHPMVRAADVEISDLEKRLAAIPHELVPAPGNLAEELRQMTDPLPAPPGLMGPAREDVDTLDQPLGKFVPPAVQEPTNRPPPRSVAAGPRSGAATQPPPFVSQQRFDTFLVQKRAVDTAQKDYRRALAREREAWRHWSNLPPVEVVAAQATDGRPLSGRRPRLAIVSLMVALAGAAGISMVASGISGSVTFTNAAGARAALSVPVLGTVSGADHASTTSRRRRFVEGSVQVVCGLFLLAVCAGVLLAVSQALTLF